jgi:hypothetical protein
MATEDETTNDSVLNAGIISCQFRRITTGNFMSLADSDSRYPAGRKDSGESGLLAGKINETSQRGHNGKQTTTE